LSEKNGLEKYADELNNNILPNIDYNKLQESYSTDMVYAKGVLNRLDKAMEAAYGTVALSHDDGDDGFVLVPGVIRGRESGNMCLALLELDLSSSGEHWGTSYLCKYGVVSQTAAGNDPETGEAAQAMAKEMNKAFIPYDYCYTAAVLGDIHVQPSQLPKELREVITDFRNHRAVLLNEEKASVIDRLKDSVNEAKPSAGQEKPKKTDPER